MALKDIEKDLHKRDSKFARREYEKTIYSEQTEQKNTSDFFRANKPWTERFIQYTKDHAIGIVIGLMAIAAVIVISLLIVSTTIYQRSFFKQEKISLALSGPQTVSGNVTTTYTLQYTNDNRADLENIDFLLRYSDNFQPENSPAFTRVSNGSGKIHLDRIPGRSMGSVEIAGKFFGPRDHVVNIGATMRYTPATTSLSYDTDTSLIVNVTSSPIMLDVSGPIDAADGDEIDYVITYRNTGTRALDDQRVIVTLPQNFTVLSADPTPSSGDHIWYIGSIAPGGEGQIRIRGNVEGLRDEIKTLVAVIGTGADNDFTIYNRGEDILRIVASPLVVRQKTNRGTTVHAEEIIEYTVSYRNEANIGLRDVILSLDIDTEVLDLENLQIKTGSLDKDNRAIVWKAIDVPAFKFLEPGAAGSVQFSVPVRDVFPVTDTDDKNFTIKTVATMDSLDIPTPVSRNKIVASNTLLLKASSPVVFHSDAFYFDDQLPGTGGLPPIVGAETVYTIVWALTNPSNDLTDTEVRSTLPTGVVWKKNTLPKDADITFDERTNEVVWRVGSLKNGVGVTSDPHVARFQVGLSPSIDQVRSSPLILTESLFSAQDVFTGEAITRKESAHDTGSLKDPQVIDQQRNVVTERAAQETDARLNAND